MLINDYTTGRMNVDFNTESQNTWLENVKHYFIGIRFVIIRTTKHFSLFGRRFMVVYIYNIASYRLTSLHSTDWPNCIRFCYEEKTKKKQKDKRPNKMLSLFVVSLLLFIYYYSIHHCVFCVWFRFHQYIHRCNSHIYGRHLTLACHLITTLYTLVYVSMYALSFQLNSMIIMVLLILANTNNNNK